MKAQIHNLSHVRRDRGYRFTDRDPDMEYISNLVTRSELSVTGICEKVARISGGAYRISEATINNWMNGKTKRPQNFTLSWVAHALGYERRWTKL